MSDNKNAFGLSEKAASVLSYAGLWVTGLIMLIAERENKVIKFHAMQSFIYFAALMVVGFVFGLLPLIGGFLTSLVNLLIGVSWAFLIFQAYMGKTFKIPVIGDAAWEQVNK